MWGGVQDKDLGKIQELVDSTTEKLSEDDGDECFQFSADDEEEGIEAAVPEN